MLRTTIRLLLAAILLAAPARATVLGGEQAYHIAYQDRLVTDVFIDGRGPYTFLIDTASSRTVIFEHTRRQLGMDYSSPDPITVYGINDAMEARAADPDSLRVAGVTVKNITMGVLPDRAQRGDPDGVLGMDVLSRYFVVLDRQAMQFHLLDRDSPEARAYAGWSAVPLQRRALKNIPVEFWFLTVRYNDHPISTLLDLGAGLTLFNWEAANQIGLKRKPFEKYGPPPEQVRDVLGKDAPAVVMRGVDIGVPGHGWRKQEILVSDAPVFDFLEMSDRSSAILGPGLMKDNSLAIDFAGSTLYMGPMIGGDDRPPVHATATVGGPDIH